MGEADFRAWEGWVHSRARTLVLGMQVILKLCKNKTFRAEVNKGKKQSSY